MRAAYLDTSALVELVVAEPGSAALPERVRAPELRTLDALHLASATSLGASFTAAVVHDRRLPAAAVALASRVLAPG